MSKCCIPWKQDRKCCCWYFCHKYDWNRRYILTRHEAAKSDFEKLSRPCLDNGAVLWMAKRFFSLNQFFGFPLHCMFIRWIGCRAISFIASARKETTPRGLWLCTVDLYLLTWAVILMAAYLVPLLVKDYAEPTLMTSAMTAATFLAIARVLDIGQLQSYLLSKEIYEPEHAVRALLNTLWHVLECGFCFAIFYMAIQYWQGDSFAPNSKNVNSLFECPVNPAYFSFVTIATLGYGDYSPQTWAGRIVVVSEIFAGLCLLSLVFQRALASASQKKP